MDLVNDFYKFMEKNGVSNNQFQQSDEFGSIKISFVDGQGDLQLNIDLHFFDYGNSDVEIRVCKELNQFEDSVCEHKINELNKNSHSACTYFFNNESNVSVNVKFYVFQPDNIQVVIQKLKWLLDKTKKDFSQSWKY